MKNTLLVNEIYDHPTVQGEGPHIGTPCVFIRLGECNQHCVWCDTAQTWRFDTRFPHVSNKVYDRKAEIHPMTVEEIMAKLLRVTGAGQWTKPNPNHIVISGGEPLLQQRMLYALVDELYRWGFFIEMETAGTILPSAVDFAHHFNVSPKLSNSGNPLELRYKPEVLDGFVKMQTDFWDAAQPHVAFKFVAADARDLTEIDELVTTHKMRNVFVMPEGITPEALKAHTQAVLAHCIQRGYRLTPRLHIDLFGNTRGT